MKLLLSSLLLPFAAAQQQRGLGKLEEPNDATTLLNRWKMDVPKIQYEDSTDIFTFRFESASSDNYNQGLAESFWNPDCMPATSGSTGHPLPVALIHDSVDKNKFPELVMDPNTDKPVMKFKINPMEFAASDIPDIYEGAEPSCFTPGVPYSRSMSTMKCPNNEDRLERLTGKTREECYQECKDNAECTQFSHRVGANDANDVNKGLCITCKGTIDILVAPQADDLDTYEMCGPPDYDVVEYAGSASNPLTDAKDSCTATSRAVTHGNPSMQSGRCGDGPFGPVDDIEGCYAECYKRSDCTAFTYWHGIDGELQGGCNICRGVTTDLVGTNAFNYETVSMCDRMQAPLVNPNSRVDFCVRSSVGYTPDGAVGGTANLATPNPVTGTTADSNYQEVNFIETLVRIDYNMASGFTVNAFSVAPKNRELTTISESYEDALIAYLCDTSLGVDTYTFDPQESYPKASSTADPFNQGALITVCVRVKNEFASQKIVLKELTDFSWSRSGGTTFNRAIGGGDDATTITQVAITGSEAAGNYLTSYDKAGCVNKYWCEFASVLFAQFYNTPGEVTGTGDAILQFKTTRNRRLGEGVDERSLQDDPGSAGMDISIDVNGVAEGPGDLKTASGPSCGVTTISVSVITALIGAVLLA